MAEPTYEMVDVYIPTYRTAREGLKNVVYFGCSFSFHGIEWDWETRYSSIHALHKQLEMLLPVTQSFVFPPKKVANTGAQFIETRRAALEAWLVSVLAVQDSLATPELLKAIQMPNSAMVWAREYTRDMAKREKDGGRRVRPRLQNMHFVDIEHTPRGSILTNLDIAAANGDSFEPANTSTPELRRSGKEKSTEPPRTNVRLPDLIGISVLDAIGMDDTNIDFASIIWGQEEFLQPFDIPEFDPDRPQAPISLTPARSSQKRAGGSAVDNDSVGLIACSTVLEFDGGNTGPLATPRPTGVDVISEAGCLGLRIEEVGAGSVGAAAGLQPDDLIMGINNLTLDQPTGLVAQQYFDSLVHLSTLASKRQGCQVHLLRPCVLVKCHIRRAELEDNVFEPLRLTMTTHDDRVVGRTHKVAKVVAGGPAAASGLKVNDVIMQINGAYVAHLAHWQVLKQLGRASTFWIVIGRTKLTGLRDENARPPDVKVAEGFLCPVCQCNLGSADALTAHFEAEHPAPPTPAPEEAAAVAAAAGALQKEGHALQTPRFCRHCGANFANMTAKEMANCDNQLCEGNKRKDRAVDADILRAQRAAAAAVAGSAAGKGASSASLAGSPKTPRTKWNFSLFGRGSSSPKVGRSTTKKPTSRAPSSSLSKDQTSGAENGQLPRSVPAMGTDAGATVPMVAAPVFRHIGRDGKRTFYNDADCKLIARALEYGDAIVRINDVDIGGADRLRFEVRFGAAAKMRGKGRSGLSPTGMLQVNLDTGAVRVVEQLSSGPAAAPVGGSGSGGDEWRASSVPSNGFGAATSATTPGPPTLQRRPIGTADIGRQVRVVGYASAGTLQFYGPHATHGRTRCGVVLDDGSGLNNGTVQGHQYFECPPECGVLVVPDKVILL